MIEGAPRATTGLQAFLRIVQVRPFSVTENPLLRSKISEFIPSAKLQKQMITHVPKPAKQSQKEENLNKIK